MDYIFSVREIPHEPLKFRARDFRAVGGGNAATVKAMRAADRGKGKRSRSTDALFKDLGI